MAEHQDTFNIVRRWWGERPAESDTTVLGIDPSTQEGAFECLILGILYSIEDTGQDIENTLYALRDGGFTKIDLLSRISENSREWKNIRTIWNNNYFNGRLPQKIFHIVENAKLILEDEDLHGDVRRIHRVYDGDGYKILQRLWTLHGIKKKAFWIIREMRMRGVWDVDGRYCCVPDKQVGSSLERWKKIEKWPKGNSFKLYLQCSEIIWDYFGELYDLPILHYAREYKCNNRRRQKCLECEITLCKARPGTVGDSLVEDRGNKYCIECGVKIPRKAKYCSECGTKQD